MRRYAMTTVSMRISAGLLAAIAALAVLLAACGGGGEQPTPAETPVATSTATVLPSGTPIITDNQFEYPARGYGVEIPEGWEVDSDYLTGPNYSIDAFFAPGPEEAGAKASIAVTREKPEENLTAESYLNGKMELIRELAQGEPQVSEREVGGVKATVVEYEPTTKDVQVEKTDVIFFQGTYGWTITLTVPAGERATYEGVFDSFLASYHVVEQ
jgi:hypothetical protein